MAKRNGYLDLPFLGASIGRRRRRRGSAQGDVQHDAHGGVISKMKQRADERAHRKAAGANGSNMDLQLTKTAQEVAQMSEEDMITDYNAPIHMWIVSTLFPLIAGTFGPMASMFNICAISTDWRIVSNSSGRYIQDPAWLIAVNVVSLFLALIANISLLGQMTSRIRYNISGPITIVGFFVSGLVDIILVAVASQILPLSDGPKEVYSQAFYYACFSGALYVILAGMLSVTAWGIWFGHYSEEFKLSLSQRSLMLQTILLLAYILGAGAVYSSLEGWDYLDSTYFVVVTVFTIGFGDYVPTTHLARSLFFPFAIGGIVFVGVIIANIRSVILESGAVKVSTRLVEKARFKAIKNGNPEEGIFKVWGIRGVRTHDTNADIELHRRRKEFRLMREIQREAHVQDRVISLAFALTAFMILWFIGGVAFWQAEVKSVGGQNWTYFEAIYFTFVAQLTIGYGDYEPQSNSSRPTFVFWALMALPTLTVLIGSVGDAVSSVVNWYTTWIGEHATALYDIFVALYEPHNRARDKIRDLIRNPDKNKDEEDQPESKGIYDVADVHNGRPFPIDFDTESFSHWEISKMEEKYKPYIMIKAMQKIVDEMDNEPPKKYNFKEWSWILKLLGEDEAHPDGHRHVGRPIPEGAEVVEPVREHKHQMWSWLGQESPLMSLKQGSEAKWIIVKMMELLEKELKDRADRHVERDVGTHAKEKMDEAIEKQKAVTERKEKEGTTEKPTEG